MATIDLRASLNAISDVVNNRPQPLRQFDQIYMKTADMLLHTDHASRVFAGRNVVFVGDGDAIGLCLVHLHNRQHLAQGPASVHILDFDERMVNSVNSFARKFEIEDRVTAELYNVADALPPEHWQRFDGFHINPPFGKSNEGKSIEAFLTRGFEATTADARGCIVIADDDEHAWSLSVLKRIQAVALGSGWFVSELVPKLHGYHLDDAPELTSCSLVIRRLDYSPIAYDSAELPETMRDIIHHQRSPAGLCFHEDWLPCWRDFRRHHRA